MFFLINKEKGISSHTAIQNFAKKYGFVNVGHSGTLDPLATGALLIATDNDTKLIGYISDKTKSYEATGLFGFSSDTLDITGVLQRQKLKLPSLEKLREAMQKVFQRESQIPPIFSAKKVRGIRAFKLAKQNKIETLEPIMCKVYEWELLSFEDKKFSFKVKVSNGTYIRSLIRDIGEEVGCSAVMESLFRFEISGLKIRSQIEKISEESLFDYPKINLSIRQLRELTNGLTQSLGTLTKTNALLFENKIVGFYDPNSTEKKLRMFGNKIINLLNPQIK